MSVTHNGLGVNRERERALGGISYISLLCMHFVTINKVSA